MGSLIILYNFSENFIKQAGAELGQAQLKLGFGSFAFSRVGLVELVWWI